MLSFTLVRKKLKVFHASLWIHMCIVPLTIHFHHEFEFYKRMSGYIVSCMELMVWYYMHRCMKSPLLPKPMSTSAEHNLCSFINTGPRGLCFFNIHVKRNFLAHIFPSAVVNNWVFTMTHKPNAYLLNCRKAWLPYIEVMKQWLKSCICFILCKLSHFTPLVCF